MRTTTEHAQKMSTTTEHAQKMRTTTEHAQKMRTTPKHAEQLLSMRQILEISCETKLLFCYLVTGEEEEGNCSLMQGIPLL